jgi:hypothetical protein
MEASMMLLATAAAAATMMMSPAQDRAPSQSGPERVAPRGSFAQSCSGAYTNQGRLYADCRDERGRVRGTSIELNRCSDSDIANINGLLVCGNVRGAYEDRGNGGGNNGGGWGNGGNGGNNGGWGNGGNNGGWGNGGSNGGWGNGNNGGGWGNNGGRDSVTVYRDNNYRGASTTLRGEVANLQYEGLNDAISSMEVRGRWEACTDANFRGYCQVFEGNVRNLDNWGMNDRISSMRPVRGGGRW